MEADVEDLHVTKDITPPGGIHRNILLDVTPNTRRAAEALLEVQGSSDVDSDDGSVSDSNYSTDTEVSDSSYANVLMKNSSITGNRSSLEKETNSKDTPHRSPSFLLRKHSYPPITVPSHKTYMLLAKKFGNLSATMTRNGYRITAHSEITYENILEHLRENNLEYFWSPKKDSKPIKKVIRGLPLDMKEAEIADFLRSSLEDEYISVHQMSRRTNGGKVMMPLFLVKLPDVATAKKLEKLRQIHFITVRYEEYQNRQDEILQCHRCQLFHHTENNCNLQYRCVKCAQGHPSKTCRLPKGSKPKCANCPGDHVASYKGCPAYKKVKAARAKKILAEKEERNHKMTAGTSGPKKEKNSYSYPFPSPPPPSLLGNNPEPSSQPSTSGTQVSSSKRGKSAAVNTKQPIKVTIEQEDNLHRPPTPTSTQQDDETLTIDDANVDVYGAFSNYVKDILEDGNIRSVLTKLCQLFICIVKFTRNVARTKSFPMSTQTRPGSRD
jgi:hypothetical protein